MIFTKSEPYKLPSSTSFHVDADQRIAHESPTVSS